MDPWAIAKVAFPPECGDVVERRKDAARVLVAQRALDLAKGHAVFRCIHADGAVSDYRWEDLRPVR